MIDWRTYVAEGVAAGIEWAWVQIGELVHVLWGFCTWNLGTTLGVRNFSRHGRRALADTDDRILEDILASSPAPSLLVETIDIFLRETIGSGNSRTAFTIPNRGCSTAPVFVWLRAEIWEFTRRAADMLTSLQVRAKSFRRVVFGEVSARYLTPSSKRGTAVILPNLFRFAFIFV